MDKNYVYVGMLVDFETYDCLVLDKDKQSCSLLRIRTRERIDGVGYSELKPIYEGDASGFNRKMRSLGSTQTAMFSRNEDKTYTFEDGSHVWFTSDTHFFHDNIIRFCDRPFASVEEMNEAIIKAWNDVIQPEDTVFHLGDFCWGGSAAWVDILKRLNGHIHLIVGNHDVKNLRPFYLNFFESVSFQRQITVEGRKLYLNHYPFLTWGGIWRRQEDQVWELFGHVHSKGGSGGADEGRLQYLLPIQYDVGVDNNNYKPLNFKDVQRIISQRIEEYNQKEATEK